MYVWARILNCKISVDNFGDELLASTKLNVIYILFLYFSPKQNRNNKVFAWIEYMERTFNYTAEYISLWYILTNSKICT